MRQNGTTQLHRAAASSVKVAAADGRANNLISPVIYHRKYFPAAYLPFWFRSDNGSDNGETAANVIINAADGDICSWRVTHITHSSVTVERAVTASLHFKAENYRCLHEGETALAVPQAFCDRVAKAFVSGGHFSCVALAK